MVIEVIQGDITQLPVDAVVNAANGSLQGGGGVDGAIHRAAGPALAAYTRALGGCPTGEARVSPGFDLPAKWIIHTVGPIWRGGGQGEPALLESCYRQCFECALPLAVGSIAFPAISTGAYGYPAQEASAIALGVMGRFEHGFERVIACCFTASDAATYKAILGDRDVGPLGNGRTQPTR